MTLQILSPIQFRDAIYDILGKRSATKNHLPSENSDFSTIFARSSPAEQFHPPDFSAPVKYDAAKAATQIGHGSVFVEKEPPI